MTMKSLEYDKMCVFWDLNVHRMYVLGSHVYFLHVADFIFFFLRKEEHHLNTNSSNNSK